jgi:glycosyltransferase involved in cell wall biosynthesis
MEHPRVSVVIPTHNRPDLITRALRSVCAQTLTDIEIIVVDDGMEEHAEDAVRAINDARIRYVAHEKSKGAPAARNRGVAESRAPYVAFLDDDDEWDARKLEAQLAGLEGHTETVAAFTGVALFNEHGVRTGERWPHESGVVNVFARTLLHPYIWTSALMIRKDAFLAVDGFDESLPKNQEWDLVLRLSEHQPFFAINELWTRINVLSGEQHMGGKKNLPNIIRGYEMLLAKHEVAYRAHPRAKARISFILFGLYRQAKDIAGMRRALRMAREAEPWNYVYLRHALALALGPRFYFSVVRTPHERLS